MLHSNTALATSYDETPYTSHAFSHCQPVRLHAIATLKGLSPAPIETARVLEIGCSFGGNLLPFAIQYPNSYSIGIDLSEQQISIGKQMLQEVGVNNLNLICADISKVNFENIQFDYIICHGVFSWVPQFVQEGILKVIKDNLSLNGIAFISYNAYPGWHHFDVAKNLMQFATYPEQNIIDKTNTALEILQFTNNILKKTDNPRNQELDEIFTRILGKPKYYVSHEYCEEHNTPLYLSQFLEKIKKYNLAYINDGDIIDLWRYYPTLEEKEYQEICQFWDYDLEKIEQYFDFISNRSFRCSVITHQSNLLDHGIGSDIRNLNLAYKFNSIYFKTNIKYVEKTAQNSAYWVLSSVNKNFQSTPLSDHIFSYLQNNKDKLCCVSNLKAYLQNELPDYDELETNNILFHIIYSHGTYFSFYDLPLKPYSNKPKLNEKYRKLAIFIEQNPNITSISNHLYQRINFDFFSSYIFKYLDGTRTIDNLVQLVKNDIDTGVISWTIDDEKCTSQQISDIEIKNTIIHILDILYSHGFFNQY